MYKDTTGHRSAPAARLLSRFDADLLALNSCFFGGGTAIVLLLDEYRESVDLDFLCANVDGYRAIRLALEGQTLGKLLLGPLDYLREVRTERDKISAIIKFEDIPVKIEILLEGRVSLGGSTNSQVAVPILSRDDMFAEKLLANADRGVDRSTMSRDIIDLAMMIRGWDELPQAALSKARGAYGSSIDSLYDKALKLLENDEHRKKSLSAMDMNAELGGQPDRSVESPSPVAGAGATRRGGDVPTWLSVQRADPASCFRPQDRRIRERHPSGVRQDAGQGVSFRLDYGCSLITTT